jgi:L-alanine-DL-glutamate epimerase-like enolase superfamily enzyme
MMHLPNALIMETVRGFVEGWYNDVVADQISVSDGHLLLNEKPGLGTALRTDFTSRPGAHVEITTEEQLQRR